MLTAKNFLGHVAHWETANQGGYKGVVLALLGSPIGQLALVVRDIDLEGERLGLLNTDSTVKLWRGDQFSRTDELREKFGLKFEEGKELNGVLNMFKGKTVYITELGMQTIDVLDAEDQPTGKIAQIHYTSTGKLAGYQTTPYQGPVVNIDGENTIFNWRYVTLVEISTKDLGSGVKVSKAPGGAAQAATLDPKKTVTPPAMLPVTAEVPARQKVSA